MAGKHWRTVALYSALAATVAITILAGVQDDDALPVVTGPAGKPSRPAPASTEPSAVIDVEAIRQRSAQREFGDMFPVRSWLPPPPPPAKPAPPRAPPLPFTFFGRMVEEGRTVVFLSRQEQVFAVKAGDSVAGGYRVEEVGPSSVVLLYLPLQERQVLNIGAIN